MKKSTRKIINYLKQYIGLEIIRTKPIINRENGRANTSFTKKPIVLLGFTADGCIKCLVKHLYFERYEKEEILSFKYTDRNWITYKKALKPKGSQLNKWIGKDIKRVRPTDRGFTSFMCTHLYDKPITLVSASKHHMRIQYNCVGLEGVVSIINYEYCTPEDWVLA